MTRPLTGREIAERAKAGLEDGLHEAAERLLELAEPDIPPTDVEDDPNPEITLRERGRIEADPGGRSVRAIVDAPYAAKQHEALHFEHPHGGEAKFLEDNVKQLIPELPGIVAGEVRANINHGRRRAIKNARRGHGRDR